MYRPHDHPIYVNTPTIRIYKPGCYQPTDPDAINYINAAGFTNCDLKEIIDNFFIALKAINSGAVYSAISLMKLYITDSTNNATALTQCSINAVNPTANVPTFVNNPTANYSGIAYNGINQYTDINYNTISDPKWLLNGCTVIGYNGFSTGNSLMFGQRNNAIATNRQIFAQLVAPTSTSIGMNDSISAVTFAGSGDTGYFAATRNANNSTKYYHRNAANLTQTGATVTAVPNIALVEGARRLNVGVQDAFTVQRQQFQLFGGAMTTANLASMQTLVNTLQGDLDNLFGLTGTNARKRY